MKRSATPKIELVPHEGERRIDVLVDGALFTAYIYSETIAKPVLFPLRTARGTPLTRGFPLAPRPCERVDHPHHVGVWFNYGDVNGLDFWNNSDAIPVEERHKFGTIRHQAVRECRGGREGRLAVTAHWLAPTGDVLLREETTYVFRATPTDRIIDRCITLTAAGRDVAFPDNKEGVFGIRVARELEQPTTEPLVLTDAHGRPTAVPQLDNTGVTGCYRSSAGLEGDAVWGTRGDWVKLAGQIGDEAVALVVFDHPTNPGYPTYWHARGYGLFAANPLGQGPLSGGKDVLNFRLAAGAAVTFRYRILVTSGLAVTDAELNREFAAFGRS